MTKHKKGSILAIIGLLIVFVVTGFIFFSMISDQIFFKHVKPVEKVEKLDKTLDKASKKQIHIIRANKYLTKQIQLGVMRLVQKLKKLWIVVNS